MMIHTFLGFDLTRYKDPRLSYGVLFSTLGAITDVLPWALMVFIVPMALNGQYTNVTVVLCALIAVTGFIAGSWFKAKALNNNFTATYSTVAHARLDLADHLAKLPLGRILTRRDGALADLLTSQFSLYQDIITHVWGLVIAGIALPVLLWLLLGWLDWRLALIELFLFPVALLTIPWAYRLLDKAGKRVSSVREEAVVGVVEAVSGARDLRFFDPEQQRRNQIHTALDRLKTQLMKTETAPAPALLIYGLTLNLITIIIMLSAGLLLLDNRVAAVTLFLSILITLRLNSALTDLGIFLTELRFSRTVLTRIRDVMAERPLPQTREGKSPHSASVAIKNISFMYGEKSVLQHISFEAPAGSITALVGPSGAGKSTLAHLIGRLWDVNSGSIQIGGIDLREMDQETLNKTISMVLQEVTLFDMSIADNIRLGRPEAPLAEVIAMAKAACIHDRIMALPHGYETVLGTGSVVLSGGEQQRLAIARALLKNAPVLILDEATASLDLENETQVQQALSNLCAGRTVFVIAHRLWTVKNADRILVLDQGLLIEQGDHQELLSQEGLYARLWKAQTEEVAIP